MKPIERLQAVFSFEEPDRVPLYDKLRNEVAIAHYAGEPFVMARGRSITLPRHEQDPGLHRQSRLPQ